MVNPAIAIFGAGDEAARIARGYKDAGIPVEVMSETASLDDALKKSFNAIEIATPIDRRASDALAAVKAGKHVSVRAPIAASLEDAQKLAEAVKQRGIKFRCFDPTHHHAPHALARKLALRGEIGGVNGIRIKVAARDVALFADGIAEPLDRLALAQWFIGPVAEVETLRNAHSSVSIIRFEKAHMFGNFEASRSPALDVPFAERHWDESIEIAGTTGIIWVNGFWGPIADRPPVVMRRFKRMISFGADIVTDPRAAYKRAAECFAKGLVEDRPGEDIDSAIHDLKFLIAALESATKGGRISI